MVWLPTPKTCRKCRPGGGERQPGPPGATAAGGRSSSAAAHHAADPGGRAGRRAWRRTGAGDACREPARSRRPGRSPTPRRRRRDRWRRVRANTPRVSPLGASIHGADCTVTRLAPAAAEQVAARGRRPPASDARGKSSLRDARAVDEHLDGVAWPRLDRLQLHRDAGGQRRAGQLDAAEPVVQRPGRPRWMDPPPKPVRKGASPGRPRTMAGWQRRRDEQRGDDQGRRDGGSERRLRPACEASRRGGAVRHRRTTSSPCSSWGWPSAPVREQ